MKKGYLLILGIVILFVIVIFLVLSTSWDNPLALLVRLFALLGFVALGIATSMTPFIREITEAFGKPFLKIHHFFAVIGIFSVTLHPILYAVQVLNIKVFIPNFDSWNTFWQLAGRPALIILFIAAAASLIRKKIPKYWRSFHALMYIVLLFGIVHANLIGSDFGNIGIVAIFNIVFFTSLVAFVLKRYQTYRLKKMRSRRQLSK